MSKFVRRFLACLFACALLLALASAGIRTAPQAHAATTSASTAISTCVAPPPNFNPLTATKSEIALYGLPPKPTEKKSLQSWEQIVNTAKHRDCAASVARPDLSSRLHASMPRSHSVTPNFSNSSWYTWSGYATGWGYGSGFDEARGNWYLPCVSAPDSYGYHSITWVGLGGWYNNQYLLQAGTINDPTWGLSLWWEAWPSNKIQVISGIYPRCGDDIFSDVWVNYSTSTSYYYVEDYTTGAYYSNHYNNFVPDRQSAEWIDERPTCADGNYTPLANFGSTYFFHSTAEVTGTSTYGSISSYRPGSIKMTASNGAVIAAPGGLDSTGEIFRDYWYGTGSGELC